jgi:hypothetical protein
MGIFATIQAKKDQFHNATVEIRKKAILKEAEKVRADNLRQNELLKARQELESAKIINQDLRAGSPQGPSKLAVFGKNLKAHMDKQKTKNKDRPTLGVPIAQGPSQTGASQGGVFGGQRNLDVGGTGMSPFNKRDKPKNIF